MHFHEEVYMLNIFASSSHVRKRENRDQYKLSENVPKLLNRHHKLKKSQKLFTRLKCKVHEGIIQKNGLTLLPYSRGKALVWDFTCVHRLAASYTGLSNHAGATVAELAESKKLRTYQELEQNYIVQPIAIESLGGIGPDSF